MVADVKMKKETKEIDSFFFKIFVIKYARTEAVASVWFMRKRWKEIGKLEF